MQRFARAVSAVIVVSGCGPSLELPPHRDAGASELLLEPAGCCRVSDTFRFSFRELPSFPFPMMFSGELSDYHRARLDAESLPSTLEQRRVALGVAETWFAPLDPLNEGETYSIAYSEQDVFVLEIKPTRGSPFRRVWPTDAEPTRFAVFCSERAEREPSVVLPSGLSPVAIAGDNRCFGIVAEPGLAPTLSPRLLFGQSVQTTLLSGTTTKRIELRRNRCDNGSSRFAFGCAEVKDDRLFVDAPLDSYWLVGGTGATAFAAGPSLRPVVRGLPPDDRVSLSLRIFLRDGTEATTEAQVMTGQPRPHVVINEVLADALGPEPQQEWIELYNDGSEAEQLSEFGLVDAGTVTPTWLPNHVLQPGAFALVARDDFDTESSWDVPPKRHTVVLGVPELVSHGLSNSGEPLSLVTTGGQPISSVPPLHAKTGISWARITPSCPDVPECFELHAAPGASPGAVNVVQ